MESKPPQKDTTVPQKKEAVPVAKKEAPKSKSLKEDFSEIEHLKNTLKKASDETLKKIAKQANVPYNEDSGKLKSAIVQVWRDS
tara:strand:- start:215 stop:466 length:252 start_codon:yes stop_codon:yes gene_type:complete